eukprot:275686-Prymnesium_polylepis.2
MARIRALTRQPRSIRTRLRLSGGASTVTDTPSRAEKSAPFRLPNVTSSASASKAVAPPLSCSSSAAIASVPSHAVS